MGLQTPVPSSACQAGTARPLGALRGAGPDRKLPQPPRSYLSRGPLAADSRFPGCPSWGGAAAPRPPSITDPGVCSPHCLALGRGPSIGLIVREAQGSLCRGGSSQAGRGSINRCPRPSALCWLVDRAHAPPLGSQGQAGRNPTPHGPPSRGGPRLTLLGLQACFCPSPGLEGAWEPVRAQEGAAAGPVGLTGRRGRRGSKEPPETSGRWLLLWSLGAGLGAGDGLAGPAAASSSGLPSRLWFIYMTRFIYL